MDQEQLASVIESILFVSNKPLSVKDFCKLLEQQAFTVQAALDKLTADRKNCGIVVLENNGEYQLATNSKNSTPVKNFLNAELREKLTDATVEVLAIIAYRQPISKAEIEAIRGVNSQYSVRHLLMRGLIEKVPNPNDARGFLYQTTTEFLQHMGLTSVKNLPEFDKLIEHIKLPQTPQAVPETPPVGETQPPPEKQTENTPQPDTATAPTPTSEPGAPVEPPAGAAAGQASEPSLAVEGPADAPADARAKETPPETAPTEPQPETRPGQTEDTSEASLGEGTKENIEDEDEEFDDEDDFDDDDDDEEDENKK